MRPKRAPKPRCTARGEHHSKDRVQVYHGTQAPLILCGYHASRFDRLFTLQGATA